MTIREYIELQQAIYGLDADTFEKIKVKVSRVLKTIDSWLDIEHTKPVSKTKAYVLDEATKTELDIQMKPYFLKISGLSKSDFEREKKINAARLKNLSSEYHYSERVDENPYLFEIPIQNKLQVMLEALFYDVFELDEEQWQSDYSSYQLFIDDEEALSSDSLAVANLRLKNPRKYYVKKKER